MRTLFSLAIALVSLTIPLLAKAQIVGDITLPIRVADTAFLTVSLSCNGDNCAATILSISDEGAVKMLIRHSVDGGHQWASQDPGLPDQRAVNANRLWKVQQIDSLNAVAVGDTNIILRTFDAGATWHVQELPIRELPFQDIHFANPTEGIALCAGHLFVTTDAGNHWLEPAYYNPNLCACHSYGNGMFRAMEYSTGEIYTTYDYWGHIDSTGRALDTAHGLRVLGSAFFDNPDTLFEGGNTLIDYPGHPTRVHPLVIRSTDAGHSWAVVFEDTLHTRGSVLSMSTTLRDTIFAGLTGGFSNFLRSTNNGRSWQYDTVLLSDTGYHPAATWALSTNSRGEVVAAMGYFSTALVLAHSQAASVETYKDIPYYSYAFPIPASESLNIVSEAKSQPVFLFDMLGRRVLTGGIDAAGNATLDVHSIAAGIYVLILQSGDQELPLARVVIAH